MWFIYEWPDPGGLAPAVPRAEEIPKETPPSKYSKFFFSVQEPCYWYGSGSSNPYLWLTDPPQDPGLLVCDANQQNFFAYYFFKVHLHHYRRQKVKEVTKSRNQGFPYYFCFMTEGSKSGSVPVTNGSGSINPKTYGSGSGILVIFIHACIIFSNSPNILKLKGTVAEFIYLRKTKTVPDDYKYLPSLHFFT